MDTVAFPLVTLDRPLHGEALEVKYNSQYAWLVTYTYFFKYYESIPNAK